MSITRETVLSSLTSGGTANINVAGNTQITGALIATIDENGNDLGQLTLNTGSLSFTDLTNIHQSNQTSGSISTSIGLGGQSGTEAAQQIPTAQDGQGRDSRFNTTNIAYSNNSQYDAEKSLATLGSGNINVGGVQLELNGELTDAGKAEGSPLDRLNRDTTNLNKDLWSVERSEGNIDLQIDHRMFSEEGRKEIAEDFKRTEILGESIADMTQDSVSFLGNGDGESSLREHIGNKQDYFTATKNFVNNKDNEAHVATLGNADATPAEKQAAYTALVNTIATQMGVDPTQAKILLDADPDFAGAFSKDTNLIYLNDLAHGSAGQAVNTLGHETQHHIDNQRNPNASGSEQYTNNRENYAGIMGNATEDYLSFNFATGGYSLAGSNSNNLGANKNDIGKNLGLVSGNYDSFSSENADSLDFRLHIGQLKSFAAEMDGCTGDQCKTGVVDKYRAIANEQNGFTPNEQIVYDQAVSSITYQLMGDCNTAQCKEYIHNQMLLVSLECGSTDCIRERGMSVRNAANILARNWSDVALDATLDGLAVAGVVVPGALPGKQVVKDALSDGAEAATRGGGQVENTVVNETGSILEQGKSIDGGLTNKSVWDLPPTDRGESIEAQLAQTDYKDWFNVGQLDGGTFPLVDFQNGNTLVSLKTVDTSGSTWLGGMQKHIEDLGSRSATIDGNPANMVLDIRVQPGGAESASDLINYGKQFGVVVIVKEF